MDRKTEGWPVFLTWTERASPCRKFVGPPWIGQRKCAAGIPLPLGEGPGEGSFAGALTSISGIEADTRRPLPPTLSLKGRGHSARTAEVHLGRRGGLAIGIERERRPRGAPGAIRALAGGNIGDKNQNVKEKNKLIGKYFETNPGVPDRVRRTWPGAGRWTLPSTGVLR